MRSHSISGFRFVGDAVVNGSNIYCNIYCNVNVTGTGTGTGDTGTGAGASAGPDAGAGAGTGIGTETGAGVCVEIRQEMANEIGCLTQLGCRCKNCIASQIDPTTTSAAAATAAYQ